jgi:ribonuclease BN (tRNA processing enzyme)
MRITVLGCSGTYAAPGGACSGYLVQAGGLSLLVDAGAGTLAELQRHLPLDQLDAVILSHSHPDHWVEMPILRNALRYVLNRAGLPVYSTAETLELISKVSHEHVSPTMELHPITDGSEMRLGPLSVRCSRTDHPPETLAVCIDDGEHRFAYSADTGPGWALDEFGRGIDLALCEATFRDGVEVEAPVHMTALQAGATAREAGVRRLMITHLLPGADAVEARAEAESAYGAPVEVASAGLVLEP